jgi:hypothetical protein
VGGVIDVDLVEDHSWEEVDKRHKRLCDQHDVVDAIIVHG